MELGRFGVWIGTRSLAGQDGAEAAELAEALGFGAIWLGGSPRPSAVRPLLAATERLTVATGIVNVWRTEPAELAAEQARLSADFPGRLLLGLGISHPETTRGYGHPLATMRRFLDGLDAAPRPVPRAERCLGALGPRMLELAAERTLGAHPYFVSVEHTRFARGRLGAEALLAPELACALDPDPERAREQARSYARLYLGLGNYTRNLLGHGFTEEDLAGGGSQKLLDAVVPQGSPEQISVLARAHLEAGADHVCLQAVGVVGVPRVQWTALAETLLG